MPQLVDTATEPLNEKSPSIWAFRWWAVQASNLGPHAYQACALTN